MGECGGTFRGMICDTIRNVQSGSIDLLDDGDKVNTKRVKREFTYVKLVIIDVLICPCIVTRLQELIAVNWLSQIFNDYCIREKSFSMF